MQRTLAHLSKIDIVWANAGVFGTGIESFDDPSPGAPEAWRTMVLTNVLGTAYTIRTTLAALRS